MTWGRSTRSGSLRSAMTTGWLREEELIPKTQGIVSTIKQAKFALGLMKHGKARPVPVSTCRRKDVGGHTALYNLVKEQGRDGALGIVQGEPALGPASSSPREAGARENAPEIQTPAWKPPARRGMRKVAYYKGCLASLSTKELDSSTQALAPMVGLELVELESVTCCGAGDIHEAEPDYYLHLNSRILAYAEAAGCDTLLTICNVCTLNLRQANWQLKNDDALASSG